MDTLILLKGGHKTLAKGINPQALEHEIKTYLATVADALSSVGCDFYIQTNQHGDNGLIVNPRDIVALVAVPPPKG